MPRLSELSKDWTHVGGGYGARGGVCVFFTCIRFWRTGNCVCVWSLKCCNTFCFFYPSSHHWIPSLWTLLLLLICRNPYGQSVGYHRAGLDHIPREWGEFAHVFSLVVFFSSLFNSICSICLLIEPSLPWTAHLLLLYGFVFAVYVCFLEFYKANEKHTVRHCVEDIKDFQFSDHAKSSAKEYLFLCFLCILHFKHTNEQAHTNRSQIPATFKDY